MNPWYATNARTLLETRQQGLKPEGPVVVALVPVDYSGTMLQVRPDMPTDRMDWRMLANLDVWVCASAKAALEQVMATTWRIAQARPNTLILRFQHDDYIHEIDCGSGCHHPKVADMAPVHEFWWTPINVGGTSVGRRINRALLQAHPYGAML